MDPGSYVDTYLFRNDDTKRLKVNMHVCISIHTCIYIYVRLYKNINTCMHIYTYIYIFIYICITRYPIVELNIDIELVNINICT
jgi:hypothetical protein